MPEDVPPGSIVVTTKDLYDDVQAIKIAVVGLPARVEKLESDVSNLKTKIAVIGTLAATLGTGVGSVLAKVLG